MEKVEESPFNELKAYIETRIRLAKYKAIDSGSGVAADLVADLVLLVCLLFVLLFASVTLACYLGGVLKSEWSGFGCVTLFYILMALCIRIFRKGMEQSIMNRLIKKILG